MSNKTRGLHAYSGVEKAYPGNAPSTHETEIIRLIAALDDS